MKIKYFIFLLFVFITKSLSAQITQVDADNIINSYIAKENISDNYWLYAKNIIISENSIINTIVGNITSPNYESWVYFIDESPYANWSHKCRFVFINKNSGETALQSGTYPPNDIIDWRMITEYPILPEGEKFIFKKSQLNNLKTELDPTNCYAVIISGGADLSNNRERYWNDCSAIYSTLVNIYGYLDDHIYVLISDGTNSNDDRHLNDGTYASSPLDLDGDGDDDTQYSATSSNITIVFNSLSNLLDDNDFLFIFTTDHGGQTSGDDVFINLWGETMDDDVFANEVNKVNAGQISVVMEQCFSGGFISDLSISCRTIATACTAYESSYAMPPDYLYDEFVYYWTSAVAGEDPYGNIVDADFNDDGYVSMQEAFSYAETADTQSETPQYLSINEHLGKQLTILGLTCTSEFINNQSFSSSVSFFNCIIESQNTTVEANSYVTFMAKDHIIIKPGFHAQLGSNFHATIGDIPCDYNVKYASILNNSSVAERLKEESENYNTI